jgi:DNA-binding CsgD family transcriptional regulator
MRGPAKDLNSERHSELCAREKRLLELHSQDLTDRKIACRMDMTHNTTRSCVMDLRRKLNKSSRTGLFDWFRSQTEKAMGATSTVAGVAKNQGGRTPAIS